MQGLIHDANAANVSRADHEIGRAGGSEQSRDVCRVVREVRIHLNDAAVTASKRSLESGHVGTTQPTFLAPVEDE